MNLNKKQSRFFFDDSDNIQSINNQTISNNENSSKIKIEEKNENNNFLFQLKKILDNPKYYNIIKWDLTGKFFIIKNINEFTEKILPIYFKHKNYSSFVRQLNLYDFHKLKSENGSQVYQHRLFVKNKSYLIESIKRKINNNNKKDVLNIDNKLNKNKIEENKTIFDNIYNELNSNKKISKQSLKKHLNILLEQTNQSVKKQEILSKKFDELSNKNENYLNQNQIILNDIIKKVHYNNKLETVILFILELIMNKKKLIDKPIILPKNNNNVIIPLPPKNEKENNNNIEKDNINNISGNTSNIFKDINSGNSINYFNSENNSYLNETFFNLTNDILSEINLENISFENKSFLENLNLDEKSLNSLKKY